MPNNKITWPKCTPRHSDMDHHQMFYKNYSILPSSAFILALNKSFNLEPCKLEYIQPSLLLHLLTHQYNHTPALILSEIRGSNIYFAIKGYRHFIAIFGKTSHEAIVCLLQTSHPKKDCFTFLIHPCRLALYSSDINTYFSHILTT